MTRLNSDRENKDKNVCATIKPAVWHRHSCLCVFVFLLTTTAWSQPVDLAPVISKPISRTVELPGEIQPFLSVSLHAKIPGYVKKVTVDRGSVVKEGQLLIQLT
ncbi:MAG TPA: efflux RND transporter periplasmic adaptor subunit, partial [Bryobacteraceae bacterium]|nr:efflux RND transporter periplasmic adaptor subunit [Bryobacteraceae bacterium]